MNRDKDKPVIATETFAAAHWLHQEQRQDVAFGKSSAARAEPYFARAIAAVVRLGEPGIGKISHRLAPQKYSRSEELQTNRRENQCQHFTSVPLKPNARLTRSRCCGIRQLQPGAAFFLPPAYNKIQFLQHPRYHGLDMRLLTNTRRVEQAGTGQNTRKVLRGGGAWLIAQLRVPGVRNILVLRACRVLTCAVPVFYALSAGQQRHQRFPS